MCVASSHFVIKSYVLMQHNDFTIFLYALYNHMNWLIREAIKFQVVKTYNNKNNNNSMCTHKYCELLLKIDLLNYFKPTLLVCAISF